MRAFAVALSAGFVAVASAGSCSQFPPAQLPADPWAEHNGITKPTKDGCTVGKPCPIEWYTNDVASTYQIELYNGCPLDCKFVACIATDLENTGKYDAWTPSNDLKAGPGYGIKLVALKEKKFQWSTNFPMAGGSTKPGDDDDDKPGNKGDDDDDKTKPGNKGGDDDVVVGDDEYCEWVDDDTPTPETEDTTPVTTSETPASTPASKEVADEPTPENKVPETQGKSNDDEIVDFAGAASSFGAPVGVVALVAGLMAVF